MTGSRFLATFAASFFFVHTLAASETDIVFSRDIRPLLSDKCFLCHGPDDKTREADLRLDVRSAAVDYGAIVPGDLSASSILERVTSDDPDVVMPPPSIGKQVTADEVEKLKAWIKQGAEFSAHYAFEAPARPSVPATGSEWEQGPIDAFVLRRLAKEGLQPSATAEREALIRRVTLDLTGLPPTVDEVDAFLSDERPNAVSRVIDRLLESPHYGEHWARWWLDAARYADSDGYEKDKPRSVWFYRDWVIRSLNSDKPYNEFVIEQIAGDLLPAAGQDERVATGFLRNSMINEEGGADPEQFRVEGMFDRMDAVGKAILGITTQCAQCHTHKYDPLTQRDYYRMFASLNDFHEATLTVFTPSQQALRSDILAKIASLEHGLKAKTPDWASRMQAWERAVLAKQPTWQVVEPTDRPFEGQKFRPLDDGSIVSESYAPTKNSATFRLNTTINGITAVRLEALTHPQLPHMGPGRSVDGTGALSEFNVSVTAANDAKNTKRLKWQRAVAEINPEDKPLEAPYLNKDPSKDMRVTGPISYAIDGDMNTAWTTDIDPGRRNRSRQAVFIADEAATLDGVDDVTLAVTLDQKHGGWNSDDNQNYLLGRYRFSVTTDDVSDFEIVPLQIQPSLGKPMADRSDAENAAVFSHWRSTVDEFRSVNDQIETLWAEHPEGESQLVAHALDRPRDTFVMVRGDFLSPGEEVSPGVPDFLNATTESDEPARLKFARWLVADDAPTTSRAIVNRIWQSYFGRGLVDTPEDLGYQSPAPSHPDLLDWLAVELVESGWSLKHIHRLIVSSAAYQQSSRVTDGAFQRDQYNVLLARGPRFRVNAEVVRDIALSLSGLLDEQIGGPSVYPEAPRFLFMPPASYGPKQWPVSSEGQQFRRSLYVHQYRSVPYPTLQVFDAPKGDAACVRRERSNTPLQALVVLNEPQFVYCSQKFAERICRDAKTDAERVRLAYRLAVSREPDPWEIDVLTALLAKQRDRIAAGELDATKLAGDGDADLAAWTVVARAILNLDETITKP